MSASSLAQSPRWEKLRRFVDRWYREPLGAGSPGRVGRLVDHWYHQRPGPGGSTEAQIAAAERRIGQRLPPAVREWFSLVGNRFCDVYQDMPVPLDELEPHDGRLPLWWENQGCWSCDAELDGSDEETWVSISSEGEVQTPRVPLAEAMLGHVTSDTLVGVHGGAWTGPLGPLAESVVGGSFEAGDAAVDARVAALPSLDAVINPHFIAPLRGHEALIVRSGPFKVHEWMAATEEAFREALTIFSIDEHAPTRLMKVVVDPVPEGAFKAVERVLHGKLPPGARGQSAGSTEGTRVWIEIETEDPAGVVASLLEALPQAARPAFRAGHRSPHVMRFVPCWPPGLASFTEPPF